MIYHINLTLYKINYAGQFHFCVFIFIYEYKTKINKAC